jgi:hypothetical protein
MLPPTPDRRSWQARGGSVAMRRLANVVTLCDGHEVFFMAARGQLLVEPTQDEQAAQLGEVATRGSVPLRAAAGLGSPVQVAGQI